MMSGPLLSVVIPNYNYAKYVGSAIDSVLQQTFKDLEIIVVDNGSTDNSLEVLRAFGDRIKLISQDNQGQSNARNRGIQSARGELIALLDADDLWLPDKLEKQVKLFSRPEVGLVLCGHWLVDRDLNKIRSRMPSEKGSVLQAFATSPAAVVLGGESTAVIRRKCFDQLGYFDPSLSISAGWDMYRRIVSHHEIDFVPEALMLYRQHGSNASARVDIFEHDAEIKLRKMFDDPQSTVVLPFKSICYGRTYLALSGEYLHQKKWLHSLRCLFKAVVSWPPGILYATAAPLRLAKRKFS